jgi:hypothetical protein
LVVEYMKLPVLCRLVIKADKRPKYLAFQEFRPFHILKTQRGVSKDASWRHTNT